MVSASTIFKYFRGVNEGRGEVVVHPQTYVSVGLQMSAFGLKFKLFKINRCDFYSRTTKYFRLKLVSTFAFFTRTCTHVKL